MTNARRHFWWTIGFLAGALLAAGCATIEGFGRDVSNMAEATRRAMAEPAD